VAERTEITIAVGDLEEFTLKGLVILERGWMKYDDAAQKDKVLPKLNKGDRVEVNFAPVEKETSPPKHYTIETLNNYLKNPFKDEKKAAKEQADAEEGIGSDDSEDYRAIFEGLELGTEATRTGIIDNARKSGYIELKKDVYTILPDGEFLIESLIRMQINMDKYKTSQLGQALKKVFRGNMTVRDSVHLAEEEIREIFEKGKDENFRRENDTGFFGDKVGICPMCGKELRRQKGFYGCSGYREGCKFAVNLSLCGKVISVSRLRELIEKGRCEVITGFVSPRTGKSFDAALKLENGKVVFDFERRPRQNLRPDIPVWDGEGAPLPEPPDDYR
jgi:DNA topoisomerase-3